MPSQSSKTPPSATRGHDTEAKRIGWTLPSKPRPSPAVNSCQATGNSRTFANFDRKFEDSISLIRPPIPAIKNAPRVSGTPEPCGARNAARVDLVSSRPARNAARLTLCFRGLRGWN
ncbi:hypothetical protein L3X38_032291 [Prunus dulcis]|uniref:Uncharacterized protein n=1 Tax=Prunus dulcis TaxID=3755 RepID=A0AAD4VDR1_PRUDU|nr:hypothetical protein L3X38_032291 [Prunus dulcis]